MDWEYLTDDEGRGDDQLPSDGYNSDVEIDSDLEARLYSYVHHEELATTMYTRDNALEVEDRVRVTQFTGSGFCNAYAVNGSDSETSTIKKKSESKGNILGVVLKKIRAKLVSKVGRKSKKIEGHLQSEKEKGEQAKTENKKSISRTEQGASGVKTLKKSKSGTIPVNTNELTKKKTNSKITSKVPEESKMSMKITTKKNLSKTEEFAKLKRSKMAKKDAIETANEKIVIINKKKSTPLKHKTQKKLIPNSKTPTNHDQRGESSGDEHKWKTNNIGASCKRPLQIFPDAVTIRKRNKVPFLSSSSSSSSSIVDCASSSDEERRQHNRDNLFIHVTDQARHRAGPSSRRTREEEEALSDIVLLSSDDCSSENSDVCVVNQLPGTRNAWKILDTDQHDVNSKRKRYYSARKIECRNCRKQGHMSRECPMPMKIKVCNLCGTDGHQAIGCPNHRCFVCGQQGHITKYCRVGVSCSLCGRLGHLDNQCPDSWRTYHSTTATGEGMALCTLKPRQQASCYNCAGKGHFGHECQSRRMTREILPNSPAISEKFAVANGLQQPSQHRDNAKIHHPRNTKRNYHDDHRRRRSGGNNWTPDHNRSIKMFKKKRRAFFNGCSKRFD